MSNQPLVSICIPNYNNAEYIGESIQSALDQTYENIEIIVCDNESTDNSWEIISSYSDERISKFKNISNLGMVGNFREVLSKANGKYVTFLCSDDLLLPDTVEKLACLLNNDIEISFAFGNVKYTGTRIGQTNYKFNSPFAAGDWLKKSIKSGKNLTYLAGTLFRKMDEPTNQTIVDLVFFDWYLWCRLGKGKVAFINDIVGEHKYHNTNQTIQLTPGFLENYYGLKKVFTLLYHNRLINNKEFILAIENITLVFSTFFLQKSLYPNHGIYYRFLEGYQFCLSESLSSFVCRVKYFIKSFYSILNLNFIGKG